MYFPAYAGNTALGGSMAKLGKSQISLFVGAWVVVAKLPPTVQFSALSSVCMLEMCLSRVLLGQCHPLSAGRGFSLLMTQAKVELLPHPVQALPGFSYVLKRKRSDTGGLWSGDD